jgi:hypothetical protein
LAAKSESDVPGEETAEPVSPESKSRRRLGTFLPWLIAVVVVVVAVAVLRLTSSTSPDSLTPTNVTSSKAATPTVPVTSSIKFRYLTASNQMIAANGVVTKALAGDRSESVASITQVATAYSTAAQIFAFEIHLIPWVGPTQVSSLNLELRIGVLVRFLAKASTVSPATLDSWLAHFHTLATGVQAGDNVVRKQMGLATTASYP